MIKVSSNSGTSTVNRAALRVDLIYAGFSMLWILFSDQILLYLVKDVEVLTRIQMIKGWVFIITTASIVYVLLYREITKVNQGKEVLRIEGKNADLEQFNNLFIDREFRIKKLEGGNS